MGKKSINSISKIDTDIFRANLLKYTKKAYQLLPKIRNPLILDVGCGSGVPTIELAKLSKGKIVAIEPNLFLLNKLKKKIKNEGLSGHIITKNQSIFDSNFSGDSFDIIWVEGVLNAIGFVTGLKKFQRILKPDGFLVIHDGIKIVSYKLNKIQNYGFKLINFFELPQDAWWKEYYQPLEKLLSKLKIKHKNVTNQSDKDIIKKYQTEINMIKQNPKQYISAFYIMQKG
jgi:ubiquinone/menaquinone biosynthesis C-methylase UbiE